MNSEWCRHFTGMHKNKECAKSLSYEKARTPRGEPGKPFACIRPDGKKFCDGYEPATAEEIAEHEEAVVQLMKRFAKATPVLDKIRKEYKGKGYHGIIDCPACSTGKLHLAMAKCNGHMHGKCSTEGCLSWRE